MLEDGLGFCKDGDVFFIVGGLEGIGDWGLLVGGSMGMFWLIYVV